MVKLVENLQCDILANCGLGMAGAEEDGEHDGRDLCTVL